VRPFETNGVAWRVVRVPAGDPRLVDREGKRTVGTADPFTKTVHISEELYPPMLDKVLLHEVAHAVTISHGDTDTLHSIIPEKYWVPVEEWNASAMENRSIEASVLASEILGRPLCIRGYCND